MRLSFHRIAAACLLLSVLTGGGAAGEDAGARLSRSLAAAEQRLGMAHPDLIPIVDRLAQQRYRSGDFDAAAALYRRSLAIARGAFGPRSTPAIEAQIGLAAADVEMQRYLEAEPLLLAAQIDLAASGGDDDPGLAPVLSGLARIALARGDAERAEALARRAVALDGQHPDSEMLQALGAALAAEDRFADSEAVLKRALALARQADGEPGAATARGLTQLASLYLRQDRYRDALPLVEEAILIDQDRLAPDHPVLAGDWYDLGVAYFGLGRAAEAERAFRGAAERLDRGPGRETAGAANAELGLARVLQKRGRDEEAGALFEDARRILGDTTRAERRRERQT